MKWYSHRLTVVGHNNVWYEIVGTNQKPSKRIPMDFLRHPAKSIGFLKKSIGIFNASIGFFKKQ